MACLAIALQPLKGPDILLQTREWFPPARALVALSSFRDTRVALASGKNSIADDFDQGLGDDPLAASSGQVIVGKESKYRVVYRLVNSIYVLGVASADQDVTVNNVFECTNIVNQAVSVVVTACRGVDVTPEKLHRKYTEIYVALDIILRGVSSTRLSNILASIHGEGIAKIVHSAIDAENRARGAESWNQAEVQSIEHQMNVQVLSQASFELPEETLSAGDEVAATLVPATQPPPASQPSPAEKTENEDPFAISDKVNSQDALTGGFKKNKEASDVTAVLAELDVTTVTSKPTGESTVVGVPGFEGKYGGIEFGTEEESLSTAFEGLGSNAFGGGLDVSEFGATVESVKSKGVLGLGGLEELQNSQTTSKAAVPGASPTSTAPSAVKVEYNGPVLYLSEEIHAEFRRSALRRVALQGTLYLKPSAPKGSGSKEIEFSFKLDGIGGIWTAIMRDSVVSCIGKGLFHIRTPVSDDPIAILKYRLLPHLTPLPLRVRLVTRRSGTLVSAMIQYVANPFLAEPLKDVTFIMKLPEDPALLKVSPKAKLYRYSQELRWHIPEIPQKAKPGCLRAQMPVNSLSADPTDKSSKKKGPLVTGRVELAVHGHALSGIAICPIAEANKEFYVGEHSYKTGQYLCL